MGLLLDAVRAAVRLVALRLLARTGGLPAPAPFRIELPDPRFHAMLLEQWRRPDGDAS